MMSARQNLAERFTSYFQHIVVAVLVELHIKLVDGEGDAAASCCGDIPDTLPVFWILVGVAWAVEGATGT